MQYLLRLRRYASLYKYRYAWRENQYGACVGSCHVLTKLANKSAKQRQRMLIWQSLWLTAVNQLVLPVKRGQKRMTRRISD